MTYYSALQNFRGILEKFQILLASDKEQKLFPKVLIVGFRNGKNVEDCLMRAALPKMTMLEVLNHVGMVLVTCVII